MTHGDAWIPIDPDNPDSDIIRCEAWSDGYLSGYGLGALVSSSNIRSLSQSAVIFAGHPFYVNPISGLPVPWGDADFASESISDCCDGLDGLYGANVGEEIEKTLGHVTDGDFDEARKTMFGSIPLQAKIDSAVGINAALFEKKHAWSQVFYDSGANSKKSSRVRLTSKTSALFCAAFAAGQRAGSEIASYSYVWDDGCFWGVVSAPDDDSFPEFAGATRAAIPLVMLAATFTDGDLFGEYDQTREYFANPTKEDSEHLFNLLCAVRSLGLGVEDIFNGHGAGAMASALEKTSLEQGVSLTSVAAKASSPCP